MTDLIMRQFEVKDILSLQPNKMQELEHIELLKNYKKNPNCIDGFLNSSVTFWQDNEVAAFGGIGSVDGFEQLVGWAMVSQNVTFENLKKIVRFAQAYLRLQSNKIYITARADFRQGARTLKFFGAQKTQEKCIYFNDIEYQIWIWEPKS